MIPNSHKGSAPNAEDDAMMMRMMKNEAMNYPHDFKSTIIHVYTVKHRILKRNIYNSYLYYLLSHAIADATSHRVTCYLFNNSKLISVGVLR